MRRLDIEPLDKARWDRIERNLRDRLEQEPISARHPRDDKSPRPAQRNVVAFALAGAAASLVAVFAWNQLRPAPHAAEHATSSVTRVETRDAPSHLAVGESSLDVAAHSVARIEGNDEIGVNVSLDRGAIDCEVSPRHGRPPFLVHAGDVTVRVVGTHFHVDHEDGQTHVSVQHGAVEVESHGDKTLVAAGASWPSSEHAAISPEDLPRAEATPSARALVAAPSATTTASASPQPSPRERYDRAAALEAARPDEALSIYRELATGKDTWAETALFAEARLELERGDKDSARKRFAEYLQRYPTGTNAPMARELSAKLQ
jgi:hypothetical protein